MRIRSAKKFDTARLSRNSSYAPVQTIQGITYNVSLLQCAQVAAGNGDGFFLYRSWGFGGGVWASLRALSKQRISFDVVVN